MSLLGKWFGFGNDEAYDDGMRLFDRARYSEALVHFEACLKSPTDPSTQRLARFYAAECLSQIGDEAMRAGRHKEALGLFERAVDLQPRFADFLLRLAHALFFLKRPEEARKRLNEAMAINPRYSRAHALEAAIELANGNRSAATVAIDCADQVAEAADHGSLHTIRDHIEQGQWDEAIQAIHTMVSSKAPDASTLAADAERLLRSGKGRQAIEAFAQAVEQAPKYADLRCRYGQALLLGDKVDEAVIQFRKALVINPAYAEAYSHLGIALRRLGKEAEALEAFDAALKNDPLQAIALEEIARPARA